jgi:putative FmdB family regulatory protein
MATYVYHCYECEYDKEVVHGMTESPKVECKECERTMSKVIRSSNFQLKGSGWFGKSKQN